MAQFKNPFKLKLQSGLSFRVRLSLLKSLGQFNAC